MPAAPASVSKLASFNPLTRRPPPASLIEAGHKVEPELPVRRSPGSKASRERPGDHPIVARVATRPLPEPGAPIRVFFDVGKLHFFDSETGNRIVSATTR